jgi:hypothetical protein
MKFFVWWHGADGGKVDVGPYSLANAIEGALDHQQRGNFLYITDDTGKRLTLKAAQRLKASADA